MGEVRELIERLEKATGEDNALDVAIEVALFEPDDEASAIRANNAGTKVIYILRDGAEVTHLAPPWTAQRNKDRTARLLRAKEETR
jgi:hypothetical protein